MSISAAARLATAAHASGASTPTAPTASGSMAIFMTQMFSLARPPCQRDPARRNKARLIYRRSSGRAAERPAEPCTDGGQRRRARGRGGALGRRGPATARRQRPRARRRPLRRARAARRRGWLPPLPHLGHGRRADRLTRPAAPPARRARRDARRAVVVPHERHPRAPRVPRLVARGASRHAVVPRRPDRRRGRRDRRLLPHREARRRPTSATRTTT